ncbi:hypothetical protein BC830DRAFT_443725 [Chytriomyces sp. MP71]|nr:hypothetical protein BC830DRAFT_443725 [Chytriomyces sp. MP71]
MTERGLSCQPPELLMQIMLVMHPHDAMRMQHVARSFQFITHDALFAAQHVQCQALNCGLTDEDLELSCLNRNYGTAVLSVFGFTKQIERLSFATLSKLVHAALQWPFADAFDPGHNDSALLKWAALQNQAGILALVAGHPRAHPEAEDDFCMRHAARLGHVECLRVLLRCEGVDPGAKDNAAFRMACFHGRLGVVKLLLGLETVDPGVNGSWALKAAHYKGFSDVVRVLVESGRVDPQVLVNAVLNDGVGDDDDVSSGSCFAGFWKMVRSMVRHSWK